MALTDIATRVYNHNFRLDPVVRTLLDTDFYNFLMRNLIEIKHPDLDVEFAVINRSKSVRIADTIDELELREQLDHARSLRFQKKEMIWLAGNTFFGIKQIFPPEFLGRLETFQLPDYELSKKDGQYELRFAGRWADAKMWDIPALSIINELRARAALKDYGRFELDVLYARAKAKLWDKIERLARLKTEGDLKIADFGTRRRHGYLWQRWCCEALQEGLGATFTGTSNVHIAMELGIEAVGTNAHELPMAYAALAKTDEELRASRYQVLDDWAEVYDNNLLVMLPDAFGTTSFLEDAPDRFAKWTAGRPDSKEPFEGTQEFINFWRARHENPKEKLVLLTDGMDVASIEATFINFKNETRLSYGWGTNLTNDFRGCDPRGGDGLDPISIVCKLVSAAGRPAVKLSDNYEKATGEPEEIARYRKIFGTAGMTNIPVQV